MNKEITGIDNFRRLHIDRKMIAILSVFTILGVCLVISIVIATNTLSSLRGYASMQAHWTEARKEATMQLENYLLTGEEEYYIRFLSALELVNNAKVIRQELLKTDSDLKKIRENFLSIHIAPDDIDNMVMSFKLFHDFPDFKEAIHQWIASEKLVSEMEEQATKSKGKIQSGSFDSSEKKAAIANTFALDKKLTKAQYDLAAALSSGTHFLNTIILGVSSLLGLILLGIGGFLSFRFLKSIKKWRHTIQINEQRYRSLFEQNPNAVYSISKQGRFVDGNKALEKMTGYSFEDLKGKEFIHLVHQAEKKKVENNFRKTLSGIPKSYETISIGKNRQKIYSEITNLPIYVDGDIIGVYGIVHDITERKEAELKIKEQLEEKTHLLAEIHDRVKNNLALISSLVQLKRETIRKEPEKTYLDSTISRIQSIALVHEQLYQNDDFSNIRMDEYLKELCKTIGPLDFSPFSLDTSSVELGIKQAVPGALLMNELLTSFYKFNLEEQEIKVCLKQKKDKVCLKVSGKKWDDEEQYNLEEPKRLGLQLIKVLIQQLEAKFKIENKVGATFKIEFKNEKNN